MSEWISVEKEMLIPKGRHNGYGNVLVYDAPDNQVYVVNWEDVIAEGQTWRYTHWQPLPEPPKVEEAQFPIPHKWGSTLARTYGLLGV